MVKKAVATGDKGRPTLTQAMVIAAARRLMDEKGLQAWSMRSLARDLSVSVSTLYWHVSDRQELIKLMIDESFGVIKISATGTWSDRLADFLRQGRNVLREQPALFQMIWGSGWYLGPQTLHIVNDVVGLIAESGTPEDEVADAYFMVIAFLFGFIAMETSSGDTPAFGSDNSLSATSVAPFPHLLTHQPAADLKGMDRRFERGIRRIIGSLISGDHPSKG